MQFLIIKVKSVGISSNISKSLMDWSWACGASVTTGTVNELGSCCRQRSDFSRPGCLKSRHSEVRGLKIQITFSKDLGFYGITSEVTREVATGEVVTVATNIPHDRWFCRRHIVPTETRGVTNSSWSSSLAHQHRLGGKSGRRKRQGGGILWTLVYLGFRKAPKMESHAWAG